MKPKLTKPERKALRFAYELACGRHLLPLPYVFSSLVNGRGVLRSPRPWIAPDSAPDRPYLSDDVLTALTMKGYLETAYHAKLELWLYRLTRDGCAAMGWTPPPLMTYGAPRYPERLWVENHQRPRPRYPFTRRLNRLQPVEDLTPPAYKRRQHR